MEELSRKLSNHFSPNALYLIFFISTIAVTLVIYWPGLSGAFVLDDSFTLKAMNYNGGITDLKTLNHFVFNLSSSILGRPVSMLSFLINDQYFPGDPASFKYTNLMIHLLCGMFVTLLINQLLLLYRGPSQHNIYFALLAGSLWLVHPINVSTTLYIVQRMTQLSALFCLISIYIYCVGRYKLRTNTKHGLLLLTLSLFPFAVLSIFSKENGVLIFFFIAVAEFTLFKNEQKTKAHNMWLLLFVVLPIILMFSFLLLNLENFMGRYATRDFTLGERLLTESRILILYLYYIIIPQSGNTGLFQDDFEISTNLISPATTLPSVFVILALLFAAFRYRRQQPVLSFGILWFFCGHLLESTILPLELYFEHRNYVPMIGPIFAAIFYLCCFANKFKSYRFIKILNGVPLLLIFISSLLTLQSASIWGDTPTMYKIWYKEHPDSLRAASLYASTLIDSNPLYATKLLKVTYEKHPYAIALPIFILDTACRNHIKTDVTIDDIVKASHHSKFTGALPIVTKRIFDAKIKFNCPLFSIQDLHNLFLSLENNTKHLSRGALVQVLKMQSDLYIIERRLSPAVESLDRAYKVKQMPEIPARQANILASAGLYKDALDYIEKAKIADGKRKPFVPSILPDLEYLEKRYKEMVHM
jgi:hypothetical protein